MAGARGYPLKWDGHFYRTSSYCSLKAYPEPEGGRLFLEVSCHLLGALACS